MTTGTNILGQVTSTLFVREIDQYGYALTALCTGTPPTTAGYFQHGCIIVQTDTATAAKALYENVGSVAVPSWNLMGAVTAGEITLAEGNILVGNGSGVATALSAKTTTQILIGNGTTLVSAALSGDATMSNAGVVTVVGATGAFNVGTNQTFAKEVNHTIIVSDSTTTNTVGGSMGLTSGLGTGTAAGGALNLRSGASSNGTAVSPGASGAVALASGAAGTATTGTAGAAGAVTVGGTAGGASTGASSVGGAGSDVTISGGAGGNSSGGGDTGGRGGSLVLQSGAGGTGATAGRIGMLYARSSLSRKFTVTAMTTTTTITTAALLGGMISANQGAAGAATYTMPIGSVMAAALPTTFTVGDSLDFTVTNVSTNANEDVTLAGDTGMTAKGNLFVPSNDGTTSISFATFRIINTGAGTFDFYRIG